MSADILDGKKLSSQLQQELKNEITAFKSRTGVTPKLTVILVGDNPASKVYVNSKHKACHEVGMNSEIISLPENITEETLLAHIASLNQDMTVHGILVQLPLPHHINENKVTLSIDPEKDVDGFHPVNLGKLVLDQDGYVPCTPAGIIELLKAYHIDTRGKHVVVLGRSHIVGKPMSLLLSRKGPGADATVTLCHSRTQNLKQHTLNADIIVAAIGIPEFLKSDMVKEGVVVVDVGINRVEDATLPRGYYLTGDVAFNDVSGKASYITPVPGGVGPLTIALLLKNTLKAAIYATRR